MHLCCERAKDWDSDDRNYRSAIGNVDWPSRPNRQEARLKAIPLLHTIAPCTRTSTRVAPPHGGHAPAASTRRGDTAQT